MNGVNIPQERRASVRLMVLRDLAELQDRIDERVRSAEVADCLLKWVSRVQATVGELILAGRGSGSQPWPADAQKGSSRRLLRRAR